MSRRARIVTFLLCAAALVGAAAALIVVGPAETPPEMTSKTSTSAGPAEFSELEERAQSRAERLEPEIKRSGVASHEEEAPEPAVFDRSQRVAEPVARRFFDAYSRYELGELSSSVRDALLATADPDFSDQLLWAPPRVPGGSSRPERAELGRLQLVPLSQSTGSSTLRLIELVGGVTRPGEDRELLSLQMELEGGRWLVTGLGR